MKRLCALGLSLLYLPGAWGATDGSGLQTAAAVDLHFQSGRSPREGQADKPQVREAELMVFAPIDHLFDGNLNLAAHQESGEAVFEIHEATIGSTKLIPRSRIKLGQYFLGVGRLNQIHRHDWPFISAPKVQRDFFGTEGAQDAGLEYGYLAPLPFFLDLSGGVTGGWTYGHSHVLGDRPRFPTHYLRATTYLDLPASGGMQTALNYLGRKDASGTKMQLWGLDLTAKWREGKTLKFLLQSEVWLRNERPEGSEIAQTLGSYLYPQYGWDENLSLGVRWDYSSVLSLKDVFGNKTSNSTHALVPTLTYKPSEFSSFRVAYQREAVSLQGTPTETFGLLELQATFILGAHPAHDF